jgi:hypothetical protein
MSAAAVLVALVVGAIFAGRAEEARTTPGRFDQASGRCVGDEPVSRERCDAQLAQVESTLKNAATAEESYATVNEGRYTDQIAALEAEGLQVPPEVVLTVLASNKQYCIEGSSEELGATLHYSSTEGLPRPGPCQ